MLLHFAQHLIIQESLINHLQFFLLFSKIKPIMISEFYHLYLHQHHQIRHAYLP